MASRGASIFLLCLFCPILIFICVSALPWSTEAARASLVSRSGAVLEVLVPDKTIFKEFVDCTDPTNVKGFCIDVFQKALSIIIPKPTWTNVQYTCHPVAGSNGYDNLIHDLTADSKDYDAVAGDITISAERLVNASFTQTYLDSGIVIVTPTGENISLRFPGVLFAPFTSQTWSLLIASILLTGSTLWLLEQKHTEQQQFFQAAPSRLEQFARIFWFATTILVFFRRDSIKNPLTKFMMMAWIFFILFLGSSYTASLSSILTVNELSQKSLSINELSNMNGPVGYQVGSVVQRYLTERAKISKIKPLNSITQYADALRFNQVVAIADEIPYISLFLAAQSPSNCKFSVGQKLTNEGLGYAFYDKDLSAAFSVALLNLSESGEMQKLQDGWKLNTFRCPSKVQSTRLDLRSSQGLFIFLAATIAVLIVIFLMSHVVFPRSIPAYARLTANQRRRDAIDDFGEDPSAHASSRRSASSPDHLGVGRLALT